MKTLLEVCEENLGIDVTPNDLIPDVVACADTITTLIRKIDPTFPLVSGTWTLYDVLQHRTDWKRIAEPEQGALVLSPTGMGNGTMSGHVGILMDATTIASNDSNTGKFNKNYTLTSWKKRYVDHGGFPILFYKSII